MLQLLVEDRGDDLCFTCNELGETFSVHSENSKYLTIDNNTGGICPTQEAIAIFKDKDDVASWIEDWRKKFPEGMSENGYRWRSPKPLCLKKMKAFIKKYKCAKDQIYSATDNYLRRMNGNFQYCKTSSNFIYKDNIEESVLFSEIEGIETFKPLINREKTI